MHWCSSQFYDIPLYEVDVQEDPEGFGISVNPDHVVRVLCFRPILKFYT